MAGAAGRAVGDFAGVEGVGVNVMDLARFVRDLPGRSRAERSAARIRRAVGPDPVLGLGGVLDGGGLLHGGAVKLVHLREAFGDDPRTFNVLYLVSSAMPPFPDKLVSFCAGQGIPLVWNQNGVGYRGWAGDAVEVHNRPMRRLRSQAAHIVYQSTFCRESAERFLGPSEVPFSVLMNPVDLAFFSPPEEVSPGPILRLLAMGTHGYAERVLVTLRCLGVLVRRGVDARLTLAGRMLWRGAKDDVRSVATSEGVADRVVVVGAFTPERAVGLYRSHHLLLHPKYLDPCPTVVIEALACGLPVVGSASGGLPEMVPAAAGRLIPIATDYDRCLTPSAEAFADAVEELWGVLPAAREAAREHAERTFGVGRWIDAHREIFRRVIG